MNLLARREQSLHELQQKLVQKFPGFDPETDILPVLERLREENLQSDARFVENYVRYRYSRGFGPLKIRQELGQKGVGSQDIATALRNPDIDWFELCRLAMVKKYPGALPASMAEKDQCYRFLAQRGFESEQIRAVLKA